MKQHLVSVSIALLLLPACKPTMESEFEPPVEDDFVWNSLKTYLTIPDYGGLYELNAASTTSLAPPSTAQIKGSAFSEDGYSYFDEGGDILDLRMTKREGEEVRGGPVYDFYQKVDYPSILCELEMEGRAEVEETLQWSETSSDQYFFYGKIWLRCLGEDVEMESGVWYDEPGVLVGEAFAYFIQEPTEEK